jgi:catechol 2,3-dioxygenase-like lactoylglutathione lyase family enzyme
MKKHRIHLLIAACICGGVFVLAAAGPESGPAEFSRTTIDLGLVVSDVEKAARFYTEAIGFQQVGSFDVPAQMAGDTGLTDSKPFQVRVFALGKEPTATKLKIMEIPGAGSKPVDNKYIGSSLGFSYLTILVSDLGQALERLKQHGVAPVKEPYSLGGNSCLILVKDPDGNIIELIGPKQ